jgi:polysaccharide biosynthesis transport protein
MQPTNLLSAVRHWWTTLLIAVILAGGAGYLFASSIPMNHEARVRMLVGPTVDDNDGLRAAGQLTRTYAELATSQSVIEGTIDALDLPHTPGALRAAIRPTSDSPTRILIIRVRDLDPDRAALIADEVAAQLALVPTAADGQPSGSLMVIDRATPGSPVGVPTSIVVALAAFAGLVTALTLALLLENLNRTVRSEEELIQVTGGDYLGAVLAAARGATSRGFVVENTPDSEQAADYRMLATKIELIAGRDGLRSVLVLGVGRARGGGELAANVAKVLAERWHCVTLVDANPATREITTALGLGDRLGLTDMLEVNERSGDVTHPGVFTSSTDPRLFVVPFGRATGPVTSHATGGAQVLERLLDQADFVLVNAAPAERWAASLTWAGAVDATVLLVPRNRTKRAELSHLVESLELVGGNVIGAAFEEPRPLISTGGWGLSPPHVSGGSPAADAGPGTGATSLDRRPWAREAG